MIVLFNEKNNNNSINNNNNNISLNITINQS